MCYSTGLLSGISLMENNFKRKQRRHKKEIAASLLFLLLCPCALCETPARKK
jgi:hypothetical protein